MNAPARNLARHSGKPAQFAPDPGRRALIAKVKIAQKQLGLDEDTYRGAMLEATGKMSAGDCSIEELKRAVAHFAARGFKPTTTARGGKSARADSPMARKARAMWISLHHLGAIDNPDEKALEAFARRQMNCEKMQWADQSKAYLLVEALKAIAERHGWRQRVDHLQKEYQLHALKANLCAAILAKLRSEEHTSELQSH